MKYLIAILFLIELVACGGGSGGSADTGSSTTTSSSSTLQFGNTTLGNAKFSE